MNIAQSNEVIGLDLDYDMNKIAYLVKMMKSEGAWESRSDDFPFYTIGKNTYQDTLKDYFGGIKDMNMRLIGAFKGFYREVLRVLSNNECESVLLDNSLSIPGFHIFPSHPILKEITSPWHIDKPHEKLGLGSIHPKAYTVAIQMPKGGGGMEFARADGSSDYIRYKTGRLYIHDGQLPHRIASLRKHKEGAFRITLQGHIIRRKKQLVTFW